MLFRFSEFELDVTERLLSRGGEPIALPGKVFDTLCVLVENHGRLLRKDDLMKRVWPDTIVEENNLDHNISKLRRALGDSDHTFIETVPRQGYRFVGQLDALTAAPSKESTAEDQFRSSEIHQDIRFFNSFDGARIAYSIIGHGPVLVKAANWLNHLEFELNSPIWRHWIPILTRHNTLIRYDERGNGLSSWEAEDVSFESWIKDFVLLTQEVRVEKFSLLGISQGAAVAVWYAAHYPEKVEKLILVGPFARGSSSRSVPADQERLNALITLIRLGWGKNNPAFRQMFTSIFMPHGLPEHQAWFNDLQRICTSPENAARLIHEFARINVMDLLPKVKCPTLVLHAKGDQVVPLTEGRVVAARIPGARFVELPTCNHLVIHNEPAWPVFVDELSRFMGWPSQVLSNSALSQRAV